jgi:hypothetical protein
MADLTERLRKNLELFNSLPDEAIAPTNLTALFLGVSERTVRRHSALPRVQVSPGRYGFRVGHVRKIAREGVAVS